MIDQPNEMDNEKNTQQERGEMIQLLALAYGAVPGDSDGYYFNYEKFTQKEIASELGYDNSTLGKMLKPDWIQARNHSYKSLIASLKKQVEINGLKEDCSKKEAEIDGLREQVARQKAEISNTNRKRKPYGPILAAALILLLIASTIFLYIKSKALSQAFEAESHMITNEGDFAAIFSDEAGKEVAQKLADEGYKIVRDFHATVRGDTLTNSEKIEIISKIQDAIKRIDGNARDELRRYKLMAVHKEINVVDIIDFITPRDSLYKCPPEAFLLNSLPDCAGKSNAQFDKKLWQTRELYFKKGIPEEVYKRDIIDAVQAVQHELSTEDRHVFNHFRQTGELIPPAYNN